MTATVDISGFNRGLAGFVDRLGIEAKVVLKIAAECEIGGNPGGPGQMLG